MKRKIFAAFLCLSAIAASAQTKARDVFAQAPDSIFPLLSTNNKLDLIDFAEAKMTARVRNAFDDDVVLDALTENYLHLRTSKSSFIELKLLPDSTILLNRTYSGPALDSEVRIYDMQWNLIRVVERPTVSSFMATHDIDVEAEASILTLICAKLSPLDYNITWTLQSTEMSKETKKKAESCLKSVTVDMSAF